MRITILILVAAALTAFFMACSRSGDNTLQADILHERDSLLALSHANQLEIDRMSAFFDEVAACIDTITEHEKKLTLQIDVETQRRYSQREMSERLSRLSEIITDQRNRIAQLVDSLNNRVDTTHISGLRSTIDFLTRQLDQKEAQINRLKAEIGNQKKSIRKLQGVIDTLNDSVGELATQNSALVEAVKVQTEIINEGYVLVATTEQLVKMGVIEKGGLLRRSKCHLGNVDIARCNKVDIAVLRELPVNSRKIKILSPAPAASYRLVQNGSSSILYINDANSSWSLSNILVIEIQ